MRLICSLDGRSSRWLRLVLTAQGDDGVPRALDGQRLPRKASAAAIREIFEDWEAYGAAGVELIVCNTADALSSNLVDALQALAPLEWVEEPDLTEVLSAWDEIMPLAGWLRGTMMALLAGVLPPRARHWHGSGNGDHWLQAWFASHLEELEQRSPGRQLPDEADPGWLECPF